MWRKVLFEFPEKRISCTYGEEHRKNFSSSFNSKSPTETNGQQMDKMGAVSAQLEFEALMATKCDDSCGLDGLRWNEKQV